MTIAELLEEQNIRLLDCPFCGCKISDFSLFITLKPVHSEEYLMAKLEHGRFLGSDNGYAVNCPDCGATSGRDTSPKFACKNWNRRSESVRRGKWKYENYGDFGCVPCCSVCGEPDALSRADYDYSECDNIDNNSDYCPNCGAKMDGGDENA
ncbi:MAG: Lar family restriction alleviation protein [Prevotella sp.]|nr:Lar family restriction alleviation protein [Alistipes senegalensis]MCM1358837.1 Lar family restriction alleviation protein [Prevotella sp.]MCM1474572.1 Lar family restriction alleviation protein [Muribaculaceae bacterium]